LQFTLHHASLLVADTRRSLHFYCDLLGLPLAARPELGFPGAWLQVGEGQQIHLLQLANPDATRGRPAHVGRDRHLALQVDNLAELEQRLSRAGIPFNRSRSGRSAIFCRDPDGNGLEFTA